MKLMTFHVYMTKVHFFLIWVVNSYSHICLKDLLSSLNKLGIFVKNRSITYVWAYFWTLFCFNSQGIFFHDRIGLKFKALKQTLWGMQNVLICNQRSQEWYTFRTGSRIHVLRLYLCGVEIRKSNEWVYDPQNFIQNLVYFVPFVRISKK